MMHTEIIVSYNRFMEIWEGGERGGLVVRCTFAVSPDEVTQLPLGAERIPTQIVVVHLLCIH